MIRAGIGCLILAFCGVVGAAGQEAKSQSEDLVLKLIDVKPLYKVDSNLPNHEFYYFVQTFSQGSGGSEESSEVALSVVPKGVKAANHYSHRYTGSGHYAHIHAWDSDDFKEIGDAHPEAELWRGEVASDTQVVLSLMEKDLSALLNPDDFIGSVKVSITSGFAGYKVHWQVPDCAVRHKQAAKPGKIAKESSWFRLGEGHDTQTFVVQDSEHNVSYELTYRLELAK